MGSVSPCVMPRQLFDITVLIRVGIVFAIVAQENMFRATRPSPMVV
jgi:hypothetical protein